MTEQALRGAALAALCGLIAGTAVGQTALTLDGALDTPRAFAPDQAVTLAVSGPAPGPFALLLSTKDLNLQTPFGVLAADPDASGATLVFDGFDPAHPLWSTSQMATQASGAAYVQTAIPFAAPVDPTTPTLIIQALAADPTHPLGARLTGAVSFYPLSAPPTISAITPNLVTPGTPVVIDGAGFGPRPEDNTLTVAGIPFPIYSASESQLITVAPIDALSGPLVVTNAIGSSPAQPDAIDTWLAVHSGPEIPSFGAPETLIGPHALFGDLLPGQARQHALHVEAGQEIVLEAYAWDPLTARVTFFSNSATGFFNPLVRIRRGAPTSQPVAVDDDSGPSLNAAIGVVGGSVFYISPLTEDVIVEVANAHPWSQGPFALLVDARTPVAPPLTAQYVAENVVRPGDPVTLIGTGFDPAAPEAHIVLLNGAEIPADVVEPGRIIFTAPLDAHSGPIGLSTPAGVVSPQWDHAALWLCVIPGSYTVVAEGETPFLVTDTAIRGELNTFGDTDDFWVVLEAGQRIALEVDALNPATDRVDNATFLGSTPADPDIRITPQFGSSPLYVFEQNGGTGFNAMIGGGAAIPAFTAPTTAVYRVRIAAWLGISVGPYVLVFRLIP